MASGAVEVKFSAAVGEFKTQVQDAARTLSQAAKDMVSSLGAANDAAAEGGKHFGSFTDILQHHRMEMRQEAGMARVLSRDLASMGLDAKGAGGEIAHLVGAFAVGGGFGFALGAVKVIAEEFKKLSEDEDKATEALGKWFEELEKEHGEAEKRIQALQDKIAGLTSEQKIARGQMAVVGQIADLEEKLKSAKAELADLEEQSSTPIQTGEIIEASGLDKARERVETLTKQIDALRQKAGDASREASATVTLGAKDYDAKVAADAQKAREKAVADAERERQRQAAAEQAAAARRQSDAEKHLAEMSAIRQRWSMKTADEEERVRLQMSADLAKLDALDEDTRRVVVENADKEIARIRKDAADREAADRKAELDRQQAEYAQAVAKMEQSVKRALNPLKTAFDQAFSGLIDGQMNLAQTMEALWKGVVKTIVADLVQMAVDWIAKTIAMSAVTKVAAVSTTQGYIAEAVAGAAASQAFIPFVGPGLAAAAAGEMLGSLEGLTAPLLAAAGGFDIPSGINPVTQLHQREMVLPAKYADVIRGMAGGGSGGDSYHVTIQATDAASFEQMLSRNAAPFLKVVRQLARNGRT